LLLAGDPCLFVKGFNAAPVAELLKLDLTLHKLFVFIGVVITALANGAAHRDKPVGMFDLCHGDDNTRLLAKMQRVARTGHCRIRTPPF
jgi:hypothetical protein